MQIEIDGLEIYGYHGVLPEEKSLGQIFRFDLRLTVESCPGVLTDQVTDTVDYTEVIDAVTEAAGCSSYNLLERVAGAVATAVLERFPVDAVWVRVTKHILQYPVPSRGWASLWSNGGLGGPGMDRHERTASVRADALAAASGAQATVYVSLGSNQGDSRSLLEQAVRALHELPRTIVVARSSLHRTAPVGYVDQPDFLNQVVALRTRLGPLELLDATQGIERAGGRVRGVRWGPRTLDVDILWYDGVDLDDDRLQVPHPRLEDRRFVLEPLAELVPDLVLASGRTVAEALAKTAGQPAERLTTTEG